MFYKILIIMATIIFIVDLYLAPLIFNVEPNNNGLFLGLMFLCIVIHKLLNDNQKGNKE